MKRLLILLILLALPAYAEDVQLARLSPAIVGGGVPVVAGGPDAWYDSGTYDSIGGGSANVYMGRPISIASGGTATKLRGYFSHEAETNCKLALYDSAGNLVTGCDAGNCMCIVSSITSAGWYECTLPGTGVSVSVNTYWVFLDCDGNVNRGIGASATGCYGSLAYTSFPEATITVTGCDGSNYLVGAYVD